MSEKDSELMKRLTQEGKPISRIMYEDFPELDYWDIYWAVYGKGQRSATGMKRMISNRLKLLEKTTGEKKKLIVDEVNELVWHLYNNFKKNQKKLENIRNVLNA
ncbi:MAG: hypothetical protein KAX28_03815 [Candidatus Marinimicrobia bacterium]|nr:hypothetical protein [Candidatus Neomarinimicrobiota bacterium]